MLKYQQLPASIIYKSIAGRYRPVSYPDGPIKARYRFINNTCWEMVTRMAEEPAHGKNYIQLDLCDQPVQPHSMARVLVYSSLNSLRALEGTCDHQRL